MKILLVGGGTGGSVSPLLAVANEIKNIFPETKFLFLGKKNSIEQEMSKTAGFPFVSIPAGKFRRYFSFRNLFSPFLIFAGLIKSLIVLKRYQPDCIFGAGSFVQVPVIWAAWFLKIPAIIHQQDIVPSLANSLCQLFVKKITVTFEKSINDFASNFGLFYKKKNISRVIFTGNPIRHTLKLIDKQKALKFFKLKDEFPTLLVLGGGTGSTFINNLIYKSLPELTKFIQIIHITGKGKIKMAKFLHYSSFEFIDQINIGYSAADFVLCRAGMSTISELSYFKKIGIIIPLSNSHQEVNAQFLDLKRAALVIPQNILTAQNLIFILRKLIFNFNLQKLLQHNIAKIIPHDAAKKIAQEIFKLVSHDHKQ